MENNKLPNENEEVKNNGTETNEATENNDSELHEIIYGSDYDSYREELGEEEQKDERLSTFARVTETKAKPKSTTLSKQTKLIIILSSIFAVILVLFFVLGPTGFDVFGFNTQDEEVLELLEGEVYLGPKRRLVFEHLEREEIQSIEVHNEHGGYTAYYNNEYGQFCFYGAEDTPYDETLFSSLIVNAGYVLMTDRLSHEERSSDYSEYGLGEGDTPAYYTITSRDGKSQYKMYIGNATLDNSGYYAMLDGRDEIYVLTSSLSSTLLADVRSLLTPILTLPISDNDYYTKINDFFISHNSEPFIRFAYVGQTDEKESMGVTIPYTISYPKYYPGSTSQIQSVITACINLTGDEILEFGVYTEKGKDENGETVYELKPELAEKYGLGSPAYDLFYSYGEHEIFSLVSFSKKQTDEDGKEFYYALSQGYDVIVKISADKVTFLEWELVDYIEKAIFNCHIDYVGQIDLSGGDKKFCFKLTGTGKKLNVTETYSNRLLKPNPEGTSKDVLDDVYNFRQFYKTSLTIATQDTTETPTEKALIAEMTVTLRNGDVTEYKFYSYSDRRCYYTVNGEGEFYIPRSKVKKLLNDAQKVVDGIRVDPEAEN